MIENSNKLYEEKITKENNISLSRNPTASLPSGIVEYSDKTYTLLIIEAEETLPQNST